MASKIKNKILVTLLFIIFILLIISGAIFGNYYLKRNNLLIYATGTHDKAFLKSTWKMSKNELERANRTELKSTSSLLCEYVNREKRTNKVSCYKADIFLYGKSTEVRYYFFENKLYEYDLTIPVSGYPDASRILENLEKRFGNGYTENTITSESDSRQAPGLGIDGLLYLVLDEAQVYIREWNTQKEIVKFRLIFPKDQLKENFYDFKNKDTPKDVFISVTYLPMMKTIDEDIKSEESSYF